MEKRDKLLNIATTLFTPSLVINVIGDSAAFIGAVCFAGPGAIVTLLSALGVTLIV